MYKRQASYTETIILNDSLLELALLDSTTVRKRLDSVFAMRDKKLASVKKKKKRTDNGASGGGQQNNSFFNGTESTATTDWYFGNAALVASGQSEFQRIWGAITLEDNWRRSNRSAELTDASAIAQKNPEEQLKNSAPIAATKPEEKLDEAGKIICLLYTSPSPRD